MHKINKTNKSGFTLVEMLLTLAILSVVMVGVISIMRSSSSFYKTGVKEVDLQEEAQVATAQIENMLIDATSNVTYSGGTYNLVLSDGQSVSLKRDATNKQLMYKVGTASFQPMADYVEAFSIHPGFLPKEEYGENIPINDVAASFQNTVCSYLIDKMRNGAASTK